MFTRLGLGREHYIAFQQPLVHPVRSDWSDYRSEHVQAFVNPWTGYGMIKSDWKAEIGYWHSRSIALESLQFRMAKAKRDQVVAQFDKNAQREAICKDWELDLVINTNEKLQKVSTEQRVTAYP